jgi:hypothetical protein
MSQSATRTKKICARGLPWADLKPLVSTEPIPIVAARRHASDSVMAADFHSMPGIPRTRPPWKYSTESTLGGDVGS